MGVSIGFITGGKCDLNRQELMITCTGANWHYGSGTTFGSVCVTPNDVTYLTQQAEGRRVMAHEAEHSLQWQAGGLLFGAVYGIDYAFQGECNLFKSTAGFKDGGYRQC